MQIKRVWLSRVLIAFAMSGLLGACGNDPNQAGRIGQISQIFDNLGPRTPGPTAAQIRAYLTPEVAAQFGDAPLKIGTVEKPLLSSVLIGVGENGQVATFTTPDGVSFALNNGLLIGSRGLGDDLMSADVAATLRAIAAGGGRGLIRVHRYLDGEEQMFVRSFVCDLVAEEPGAFRERCQGETLQFENIYRIGANGAVASSRQWIGPERGYLSLERFRD